MNVWLPTRPPWAWRIRPCLEHLLNLQNSEIIITFVLNTIEIINTVNLLKQSKCMYIDIIFTFLSEQEGGGRLAWRNVLDKPRDIVLVVLCFVIFVEDNRIWRLGELKNKGFSCVKLLYYPWAFISLDQLWARIDFYSFGFYWASITLWPSISLGFYYTLAFYFFVLSSRILLLKFR